MWTLDTSVYVRAADPYDPDQAICQALIDVLDDQAAPIIVPRLLLTEIAGALRRLTRVRFGRVWLSIPSARCHISSLSRSTTR